MREVLILNFFLFYLYKWGIINTTPPPSFENWDIPPSLFHIILTTMDKTYLELAEEYTDSWFEGTDCNPDSIISAALEDQVEHWIDMQEY